MNGKASLLQSVSLRLPKPTNYSCMVPLTMACFTWFPSFPFPLFHQTKSTMMSGNTFVVPPGIRSGPAEINKTKKAIDISLGCLTIRWQDSNADYTTHFGCSTFRNQSGTDPMANFHSARRCYVGFWERKVINGIAQWRTLNATVTSCQVRCVVVQ